MKYVIVFVSCLLVLCGIAFVVTLFGRQRQTLTKQDTAEWNQAERSADHEIDEAEAAATKEVQAINQKATQAIRVVQTTAAKQVEADMTSKDPERTLEDALDEYDHRHGRGGILSLLLPWVPLLWSCWVLSACSTVHGSGGGVETPTVTVKRATWERAVKTIRTCTAEITKQKLLRQRDADVARVQCDRRVKQCRAVTDACRKQRGVLMRKSCPTCTKWIIATTVATIAALAAGGTALYFAFRPTVTLNPTGGGS